MSYRAIDTSILASVNVDTDTFQVFINKMNWIVDHLQNTVVTVSNTAAYNGNNTGNGFVFGIFGGNTLVATTGLRGGNVSVSNTLFIPSAAQISNNLVVTANLTVNATSSLRVLNVSGTTNIANTLTVSGATTLANTLNVAGQLSANAQVQVKTDLVIDASANTNLGANITAPQTIFSFLKTEFTGGKALIQSKLGSNSQIYEAVFTHNGSDPSIAIYGVASLPAAANNGVLVGASNTTHILLRYQQTAANTSVKTAVQLLR